MTRVILTALAVLSLVSLMGFASAISNESTVELKLESGEYFIKGQLEKADRESIQIEVIDGMTNEYQSGKNIFTTSQGSFETSITSLINTAKNFGSSDNLIISVCSDVCSADPHELNEEIKLTVGESMYTVGKTVHMYEYPFNATVVEGGKIVIHNESQMNYEIEHTKTTGTEKGGTFSLFVGTNSTGTLSFPIDNCSSCYPAGEYYYADSINRNLTGIITIVHPEGWTPPVNEEVGIQETVVVVLGKPEVKLDEGVDFSATSNSTEPPTLSGNVTTAISSGNTHTTNTNSDGIYNVPEYTGTYDVLKLQQQLAQVTSDYTNALETIGKQKSQLAQITSDYTSALKTVENERDAIRTEIHDLEDSNEYLKSSQTEIAEQKNEIMIDYEQAQKELQVANDEVETLKEALQTKVDRTEIAVLNDQVSTLKNNVDLLEQQKAEITIERDNWKQLADNWYAIALEQVRVMVEVLGL